MNRKKLGFLRCLHVLRLQDVTGDHTQGDWTLILHGGATIESQDANSLTLSPDASGQITHADGSTLDFAEIETIEW